MAIPTEQDKIEKAKRRQRMHTDRGAHGRVNSRLPQQEQTCSVSVQTPHKTRTEPETDKSGGIRTPHSNMNRARRQESVRLEHT